MNNQLNSLICTDPKKEFIELLYSVDHSKRIYEIFHDFVFCSAAAIRNSLGKIHINFFDQNIENQFYKVIEKYPKDALTKFQRMFALMIICSHKNLGRPYDFLGETYMSLELGNQDRGQYFTPNEVSRFMAEIQIQDTKKKIEQQGFVKISDPSCGAGSTLLAVVNLLIEQQVSIPTQVYIEGVDIDKNVALMCYLQLSLWGVPCRIFVGDSLTNNMREQWVSPIFVLYRWHNKLGLT